MDKLFSLLVAHANPHTETNAAEANTLLKKCNCFHILYCLVSLYLSLSIRRDGIVLSCTDMKLFSNYFFAGEALTGMLRCQMDDNKRVIKKDQSASGIC